VIRMPSGRSRSRRVEYRPPDPREIDDELRMARQLRQEAADMGDDAGIRCSQRYALEMPDLKDRRLRCCH
jgi:glutamine synthetase